MFLKKDKDEMETPNRRLEDNVAIKETAIAPGTKFHGTISGQDNLRVGGFFEGEIDTDSLVWIDKGGQVQGTVKSRGLIIEGEINGNVEASEKIEVRQAGRVIGNIKCHKIALAEGCFFQGEIQMPGQEQRPHTFVEKRQAPAEEDTAPSGKKESKS